LYECTTDRDGRDWKDTTSTVVIGVCPGMVLGIISNVKSIEAFVS
jgi:hypothetical protein